jgi:5-methyltetrahydropteroyltriglutamate--homocysteine methyltransferase
VAPIEIRTTHTGSLPRPDDLVGLLYRRDGGETVDGIDARVRAAVDDVVARQVAVGLDVVSDGEQGRISYATYVARRLSGFTVDEGERPARRDFPDIEAFPEFATRRRAEEGRGFYQAQFPVCTGPVAYVGHDELATDLAQLRAAVDAAGAPGAFVTAASPGVIAMFLRNRHHATREAYIEALGDAMRHEYRAIVDAGFTCQLDCPDLAFGMMAFAGDEAKVRRHAAHALAVLDAATEGLPPESLRMHVCWGNYEGPHHLDVPHATILDVVLAARPSGLVLEAANPRHAHEWRLFAERGLPDGKVLVPGLIDSTTNYVEHPEVVAQRLARYVDAVGAERVMAGTDCGFGTIAGRPNVVPDIVYAKLGALVEGTRLVSGLEPRGARTEG